jgi:hypothetical protein
MPTVASSVTSEQAPSGPAYSLSIQSLYQASDVFAFAHRLAIEVLHEETAVKEAYDREPLKGRTYMSLRPWNVEQLDRPNSRYADQEHFLLVHGGWADDPGRLSVYDILIKYGFNVSVVR